MGTDARDLKESARADSIIIATLDNNNKVLMARRYYFLTMLGNFEAVFGPININI